MNVDARIFVAGHRGLVGSACARRLEKSGFRNLLFRTRQELDLSDRAAVDRFFAAERPDYVILAAARVGGILANRDYPVEFLLDNLEVQNNVIIAAHRHPVKKLLFLGSSCIYPRLAPQPMREDSLLSGPLEPTNEPYAIAKIAGIKLCQSYHREYGDHFISCMPTNLYGPHDNFDLQSSHVLPALIRRFGEARDSGAPSVTLWGTGSASREFLYVDDFADAALFLLRHYDSPEIINVGTGRDQTIRELAELIARLVGYTGTIQWDDSKPDGTPRKLLDVSKLRDLGWTASTSLEEGIRQTIQWRSAHGTEKS